MVDEYQGGEERLVGMNGAMTEGCRSRGMERLTFTQAEKFLHARSIQITTGGTVFKSAYDFVILHFAILSTFRKLISERETAFFLLSR